jgi:hypothetical protein
VLGREAQCFPPMAVCTGEKLGKGIKEREQSVDDYNHKPHIFFVCGILSPYAYVI